jgi:hypothetical protein
LIRFVFIWYIFFGLGNIYKEKSGNPVQDLHSASDFFANYCEFFTNLGTLNRYLRH